MLLLAVACAQKPTVQLALPIAKPSDEADLVTEGNSSQPSFSRSGERLLFVSQKRRSHQQAQVYEKDLKTGVERRLTYQNGSTLWPRFHPKDETIIVYASTTDELKENSPLLRPKSEPSKLPIHLQDPSEIYIHSLRNLEIRRVTEHPGFDGEPRFSADGRFVTYTTVRGDRTSIIRVNGQTRASETLPLAVNPTNYVSSTDGKTQAWIAWDPAFGVPRIHLKLGAAKSSEINSNHIVAKVDLDMSADGKFLLWSQFHAVREKYEIWLYDVGQGCAFVLAGRDDYDRRHPTFSPDLKTVAFTRLKAERSRIVTLPFQPPTGSCPKED